MGKGWNHIYTDGLKSEMGVGAAVTNGSYTKSASLLKVCSIFTAKTHAIHFALNLAKTNNRRKFAIFTDLLSSLQALQKRIPTNPKVLELRHTITALQKFEKIIDLCWKPGHAGIPENQTVD